MAVSCALALPRWCLYGFGAGVLAVSVFYSFFQRMSRQQAAGFILSLISVFYGFYFYGMAKANLPGFQVDTDKTQQEEIRITGTVESAKKNEYGIRFILKDCVPDTEKGNTFFTKAQNSGVKVVVTVSQALAAAAFGSKAQNGTMVQAGTCVRIGGSVQKIAPPRNEGEFDAKTYYQSFGICCQITAETLEQIRDAGGVQKQMNKLRTAIERIYTTVADPSDAGVLNAIVLGDRTEMDGDTYRLYQRNGIAHLFAISGLHVSFLGLVIYEGLKRLLPGYLIPFCAGMLLLSFYGALTGSSVSVKRAVFMCVVRMGADVLGRTYDLLSALCLSSALLVLENVYILYHSGFQLSFAAMLGISVLYPALEKICLHRIQNAVLQTDKKREPWKRYGLQLAVLLIKSLLGSLSISLMTLPITAYYYFRFPCYSVILNIIVIPPMSTVMLCAMLAAVLGFFWLPAASFLMGTVHYILRAYEMLCGVFDRLPGNTVVVGRPKMWQCAAFYILILLFVGLTSAAADARRNEKNPGKSCNQRKSCNQGKNCGLLPMLLIAAVFLILPQPVRGVVVDMIDVGQGDCILVRDGRGVYLFDGGSSNINAVGSRRIVPMLQANGITRLNYIFVSHCDTDHISGIMELIAMQGDIFAVENLVLPKIAVKGGEKNCQELLRTAQAAGVNILLAEAGTQIGSRGGADFLCLHPTADYQPHNTNDASAVYLLRYRRFTMLFTGDIEAEGEWELSNGGLQNGGLQNGITVLKVAHHGSSNSSRKELLENLQPSFALISCGVHNPYGHPSRQTLDRLAELSVAVCITARDGQITIQTDGSRYAVRTWIK